MITITLTEDTVKTKREVINNLIDNLEEQLDNRINYNNPNCDYKDSHEYEKLFSTLVMLKNKLNKFSDDITSELELMTLV